MNSVALSTSNISNFVFFISWADDIQVGESIYISSVTAGVNGVAKNVITNFKDNSSLSQVSVFWADACTASIDTTIKHEGEEASLKYTYNQEQNFNYIILNAPLNADVSAYDYIAFFFLSSQKSVMAFLLLYRFTTLKLVHSLGNIC